MVFVYILLALVLLFIFMIFPATRRHPDREIMRGMYIAHRGLHSGDSKVPENSLLSFEKAVEKGFAIETDIHITADNEVIIFHDNTFKRMCGDDRRPEDMTLSEIKKFRLLGTENSVPTLKECLDLVDGRVPLLIEFKTMSPKTCDRLCCAANEILKDYSGKYFVQSFYPFVPNWYKKNRPDIMRGQLSSGYFKEKDIQMKLLSALLYNFIARPDFVAYEHKYKNNIFRCISAFFGAYSVGWTFTSQSEVENAKDKMNTFIFELFIPKDR